MAKSVLWDPSGGSSRFVVGGTSELRMYEWEHTRTTSRLHTRSVCSELSQLRTFDWAPHPSYADLLAVGLTTGRTLLLRLDASASPSASHTANADHKVSALQLNVRHSRPCNVVAFGIGHPGLLAVGLEKGRGESLLVFDIEQSAKSLDGGATTARTVPAIHHSLPPQAPRASSPASSEARPLYQFGSSETVTSACFLVPDGGSASSSPLLVAGMGQKSLRAFDLRNGGGNAVSTWGTRSLSGIVANPFNGQQFASFGEDGSIKVWDLRKPVEALLSFSESDAGSVKSNTRGRSTLVGGNRALAEVAWSRTRMGVLTSLEVDSTTVRVWNIAEGAIAKVEPMDEGTLRTVASKKLDGRELRLPILLSDAQLPAFRHPLTSFAYATSPTDTSNTHILGISRDNSSSPGTSGHRLEIISIAPPSHASFLERGILLSSSTGLELVTVPRPLLRRDTKLSQDDQAEEDDDTALAGTTPRVSISRSGNSPLVSPAGELSTSPGAGLRKFRSDETDGQGAGEGRGVLEALGTDPSVVVRLRVEQGYGSNPILNASLVDSTLEAFWNWISRAEILAQDGLIAAYDFRYRGVLSLLDSFPSSAATPTTRATNLPSVSVVAPNSIYNDFSRTLRRGDEARAQDKKNVEYESAAAGLVSRRRLEGTFTVLEKERHGARRRLALQSCGRDWEEDWEEVCTRMQGQGNHERAARHAFFSGHLEKTMQYLRLCKDERLRLLTPVLAAYLAQKDLVKDADTIFADSCRTLSADAETPWVRAMFAFLATGDWREVLDESGLPVSDRVAIAIRFLSDSELLPFLQSLATESVSSGDLSSILLFGLQPACIPLLQSYLNRTGDLQTIALASTFISPALLPSSPTLERWIKGYSNLLDKLMLYTARALMDSARGRRARTAAEQSKMAGRKAEAERVEKVLNALSRPVILVRCQFCAVNITPGASGGEKKGGVKSTLCPNCSKSLPNCSVCLTRASIHSRASEEPSTLCWCQGCRHGGHTHHILEWFAQSEVCPVADCDCRCRSE